MTNVLWGRSAELAVLRELLDRPPSGGGTLVVRGGAGVGKSALLTAAVAEAAARNLRVLAVAGFQAECRVPFAGLHTLLTLLDEHELPDAAESHESYLFKISMSVMALLTAQATDRPLVVVVDDGQWLDGPTWEVLAFVGRRLAADPVVLLVAMRDGEETDVRLAGLPVSELRVEPLSDADSRALLDERAPDLAQHLRARVLAEADGNPLGLVELAVAAARFGERGLIPARLPLTTRLERTFGLSISELPAPTRVLLLVAALDDGDGLAEMLAASSIIAEAEATIEDVEPALAARLLEVDDAFGVRFRHPLVRSSVFQAASASQRQRAHAALARVLTDRDRSVWHRAAATMATDEQLADDLAVVGERMYRRGAMAAAITAWEQSARLTGHASQRASRLLLAVDAAVEVADHEKSDRLVRMVVADDLPADDQARLQWLRERIMDSGWSGASRLPEHLAIAKRMSQAGRSDRALNALYWVSLRGWWSNPGQGLREDIISVVERLDVSPLDPRLVSVLGLVAPVERGAVVVERLTALQGRTDIEAEYLLWLGVAASGVGALGPSAVFSAAAVAALREQGRAGWLAQALVTQAWTAAQLGDTVLGLTAAAEARALAAETRQSSYVVTADLIRAQVEALRGHGRAARALAGQGEQVLLSIGAHTMLALVQVARGIEALSDGRYAEAYDALDRIFESSDVAYHPYVRFSTLGHLVEAGARGGRPDEARARVRELEPIGARTGSPALRVGLVCATAMLAPDDEAEMGLRSALDADLAAWPFERARLQLALGTWLRRRRPAQARPALRAAITTFEALGAKPWADRARRELRASGENRRRPDDGVDQLTPQELQVARLVAEGLTNREIGGRLFLSPRTVSTHLYHIYPKVGISSRAELAGVMARLYVR